MDILAFPRSALMAKTIFSVQYLAKKITKAANGDEEAAIQSFARILALDPNHTPDRERTSPKIRQLFEAARSAAPSEPVAEPVAPPPASSSSTPR